jgi:hypothetical protein
MNRLLRNRFVRSALLLALAFLIISAFTRLRPGWDEPGHRDIVIILSVILIVTIQIELGGIVTGVTDRLLPHIGATMLTERATKERFDRMQGDIEDTAKKLTEFRDTTERRLYRIETVLGEIPGNLGLKNQEAFSGKKE